MTKDPEEATVVSAGSAPAHAREVKVKRPEVKAKKPFVFPTRVFKLSFHMISKLIKIIVVGGLLAVLSIGLHYSYTKAKKNDISVSKDAPIADTTPEEDVYKGEDHETVVYNPDRLKSFGTLRLNSTPDATVIMLNGKRMIYPNGKGVSTPLDKILLAPGEHRLTLTNTSLGFSRTRIVTINRGDEKRLDVILRRN